MSCVTFSFLRLLYHQCGWLWPSRYILTILTLMIMTDRCNKWLHNCVIFTSVLPLLSHLHDLFHSNVTFSQLFQNNNDNQLYDPITRSTDNKRAEARVKSVREYFWKKVFFSSIRKSTKTGKNSWLFIFWFRGEPIVGCLVRYWLTSMLNVKHNEYLKNMKRYKYPEAFSVKKRPKIIARKNI